MIRAEKEKQRAEVEEQARLYAERIAKARAKVHAAPLGLNNNGLAVRTDTEENNGASRLDRDVGLETVNQDVQEDFRLCANKTCARYGHEHEGFCDWNRCRMQAAEGNQSVSVHTV